MIKYNLICALDHEFEAWFSKGSDFDDQKSDGLLLCPICGDIEIDKAIMAPAVSTSRKKDAAEKKHKAALSIMNAAADKIRKEIAEKCDDVGDRFADEARAIHYGEKEERAIYGSASPYEAAELRDEGIAVAPLPEVLVPKPDKKLN